MCKSNSRQITAIRIRAVICLALGSLLAACVGTEGSGQRSPSTASRVTSCSERVIVNMRMGMGVRNDFELMEAGRRAGVQIEVLQQMGRGSRMVMIRGMGPQALCESAIEEMGLDPRIESVQRYF